MTLLTLPAGPAPWARSDPDGPAARWTAGDSDLERLLGPVTGADVLSAPTAAVSDRAGIARAAADWIGERGGDERARAAAERLAEPDAVAVVAGQQPGPLGGPLYCLGKAWQCVARARVLEARWGVPVVPVFVVAGDDHDRDEARAVHVTTPGGRLRRITADLPPADVRPHAPLEDLDAGPYADALAEACEALGADPDDAAALRPAAGESVSAAQARALLALTAGTGCVVLDPGVLRPFQGDMLERAVAEAADLADALAAGTEAARAAGVDPGLPEHRADDLLPLFRVVRDGDGPGRRERRRLSDPAAPHPGDRYAGGGGDGDDGYWSPDAGLRTVLRHAALPVVETILGPGEARYHCALAPAYEHLGVSRGGLRLRVSLALLGPGDRPALEAAGAWSGDGDPRGEGARARADLLARADADRGPATLVADAADPVIAAGATLQHAAEAVGRAFPGGAAVVKPAEHAARAATEAADRLADLRAEAVAAGTPAGSGLDRSSLRDRLRRTLHRLQPAGRPQERTLAPLEFALECGPLREIPGIERAEPGTARMIVCASGEGS